MQGSANEEAPAGRPTLLIRAASARAAGPAGTPGGFPLSVQGLLPGGVEVDLDERGLVRGPLPVLGVAARCPGLDLAATTSWLQKLLGELAAGGTRVLNLVSATLTDPEAPCFMIRYQQALNFSYELLRGACWAAESSGVTLAVEANQGGFLVSPVEAREFLDAINSPAVGACLDGRLACEREVLDWLETLSSRIKSLRLGAGPKEGILRRILATSHEELFVILSEPPSRGE